MKNPKSKSQGNSNVAAALRKKAVSAKNQNNSGDEGMQSSQLMKLFENELKDIYWEKKHLPKQYLK